MISPSLGYRFKVDCRNGCYAPRYASTLTNIGGCDLCEGEIPRIDKPDTITDLLNNKIIDCAWFDGRHLVIKYKDGTEATA